MTNRRSRRWFQLSLKSLFGLTLLVATFFAGYTLATRQAEAERWRAEQEAQRAIEEARLQSDDLVKQAEEAAAVARAMELLARQQAEMGSLPKAPVTDH